MWDTSKHFCCWPTSGKKAGNNIATSTMTCVELTKAFDTVSTDGLWKIIVKFGCPRKLTTPVPQFYDGMVVLHIVNVLEHGDESGAFPLTQGVK
ncbi:hypothetical protein ElyMa_004235700 [Elysia marginata]|uniref:Reverse transcriptase domain-containing protein n=1 Tax=Elysia marginata TaxID=1093978 RepID=A0AAV4GRI2_9GAST|nr:hypothetical protein ElyMa_004235700 [Elysia marginata]